MKRESGAMTAGQARMLLDLPAGADAEAVSRAFRSAVKSAHPDLGGDPERLRRVIEAHRVLKSLAEAKLAFTPATAHTPTTPTVSARAIPLQITVAEALLGGRRRVELQGRGVDVHLPEGLRAGDSVRLANAEGDGADVLLRISIAAESGLSVHGHDVWLVVEVSRPRLREGARLEVQTPRGRRSIVAPETLGDGAKVRLKGEGLPARERHPAGDLILRLKLDPAAEEPVSRRLLRRFSARWAA
jgi:curved DNA-binding protein